VATNVAETSVTIPGIRYVGVGAYRSMAFCHVLVGMKDCTLSCPALGAAAAGWRTRKRAATTPALCPGGLRLSLFRRGLRLASHAHRLRYAARVSCVLCAGTPTLPSGCLIVRPGSNAPPWPGRLHVHPQSSTSRVACLAARLVNQPRGGTTWRCAVPLGCV
jgi:hypothetical protein